MSRVERPVEDLDARRMALDPSRSFIVQAPAGSGKTELLIQRTLRLLARVDEPEEIAAITFTRKAAGEMRKRVLEALERAASEPRPEEAHRALTWDLARAALERDRARGWELSHNASRLRVQTIDSLCASLTRQMPVLSRFGAQPESVENEEAQGFYREAARATLGLLESREAGDREAASDAERLLTHLDNNLGAAEGLIASALAERDKWLRNLSGAHDREALEAALVQARRDAMERAAAHMPSGARAAELLAVANYAASNLAASNPAAESSSPIVACEGLTGMPGAEDSDLPAWAGLAELLLTQAGEARKPGGLNVRVGFPPGATKAEKEAAKAQKDRAGAVIAVIAENEAARNALHALRLLPPARYEDSQWAVLGAIARLVRRATAELRVVFGANAKADFVEVAHRASDALGTAEEPTELALSLDYRIRHLLVDEFQDTSFTQYELLEKLTAGWQPDDGRTLFLVGDPMQSIYRFREAEVGLFLRARRDGLGDLSLHPLTLSVNFRSQRGVVDWVNATFGMIMPAEENVSAGAVPYTDSVARHDRLPGEAVSVHPLIGERGSRDDPDEVISPDVERQEAMRVVDIAREARRENPQGSIAILVRGRTALDAIVPALREAGLPFRAIDIERLGHRQPVQDLLALTRALCHPADRLAWLAVLRAPWCGLTLADIHALCQRDAGSDDITLWEAMQDEATLARLSDDGRSRLARTRSVLEPTIAQRLRAPLRDAVEGAWLALGGPACAESRRDLEDAEIFLDRLDELEEAGTIADFDALEQSVQRLFAAPGAADDAGASIDIMTIHKAKGLEFDTVIVPGLGRGRPADDAKLFRWMERASEHDTHASELLLAPIKQAGAGSDAIYDYIRRLDEEKGAHEDARLLYVAATRAKHRLHLLGRASATRKHGPPELQVPTRGSLLATLWPAVELCYAEAVAKLAGGESAETGDPHAAVAGSIDSRLRRLPSGWLPPAPPPSVDWTSSREERGPGDAIEFSWVSEAARQVGNVVHRWLQRIAEDALHGWDRARVGSLNATFRRELAAHGVANAELEEATARVVAALSTAVTGERGRWLLGPHPQASSEQRVRAVIDGRVRTLVIDRRFVDAGGREWIADYKTSRHEGGDPEGFLDRERERYRAQLERYARALGLEAVSLGLYFPQLAGWREWEPGSGD